MRTQKKKQAGISPIVDVCPKGHTVTHENKVPMPDKTKPDLARCLMCGAEWVRDTPVPADRFSIMLDDNGK